MKQIKTLNIRLSAEEHEAIKTFALANKTTISDLVKNSLLKKIIGEADAGASILEAISKIKDDLGRISLVADAALIATCRYHFNDSEDLAGLDFRRTEALGGAKKRFASGT